jgi:hypothetical protein
MMIPSISCAAHDANFKLMVIRYTKETNPCAVPGNNVGARVQ